MISPDEFDALATRLVGGAEERYIATLTEQLVATFASGGTLNSWTWRDIEEMAQVNHQKLQDLTIRFRTSIDRDVEAAVNETLKASAADDAMALASQYGPAVKMAGVTRLYERISAQTVEGVQSIIARQNIALAESAERLWYEVASDAVTAWDHGTSTMDAIMRTSVERLSREGLTVIDYKSGQHTSIDAAIRRHAVSQIGQASGRITMGYMTELGHDLVFTSAHMGARPEHEVWQGKAFSLSGAKVKDGVFYPDFYRATGYGTVTGLLGVNCRHSFSPWTPGLSQLPELPEKIHGMDSGELYDQTQKQRGYERDIRRIKKDIALGEKSGLDMTQKRLELGRKQAKLKALCDEKKLVRQYQREKAYAIGAQPRALRAARSE